MDIEIKSAELCKPLDKVRIIFMRDGREESVVSKNGKCKIGKFDSVKFEKQGYINKEYHGEVPKIVRLLEDRLIAYQDKLWFQPGDDVKVFMHSSEKVSAILYRHGINKEPLLNFRQKPHIQQVPDSYFVDQGPEWKESFSYNIPKNVKPGLYSLLLENTTHIFAVPMIVSTKHKKSNLLVLASTNTWQSYNIWGGRSRYKNFEKKYEEGFIRFSKLPFYDSLMQVTKNIPRQLKEPLNKAIGNTDQDWYHYKLSVRRPFTNCALESDNPLDEFTNHLAAGEWRVLAWLEREGIDYDIISGFELDKNPELLKNYKAIILNTHSEYWSKNMYDGLKKYNEERLWILNVSGNSIYREVEFFKDGSHKCTSLSFCDSCDDESRLLGVRFTPDDYGTCAPYQVKMPNHWIFKGVNSRMIGRRSLNIQTPTKTRHYNPGRIGLKKGLTGMGASGWETDKITDAAEDFLVVAKGTNKNGGADMIVREPKNDKGGVFSVSSITFGGSLLVDTGCSTVLKNAIYRSLR